MPPSPCLALNDLATLFLGPPLLRGCLTFTPRLNRNTGVGRSPHSYQFPVSPDRPCVRLAASPTHHYPNPRSGKMPCSGQAPLILCRPFHDREAPERTPTSNHKMSVSTKAALRFSMTINLVFLDHFLLSPTPRRKMKLHLNSVSGKKFNSKEYDFVG